MIRNASVKYGVISVGFSSRMGITVGPERAEPSLTDSYETLRTNADLAAELGAGTITDLPNPKATLKK